MVSSITNSLNKSILHYNFSLSKNKCTVQILYQSKDIVNTNPHSNIELGTIYYKGITSRVISAGLLELSGKIEQGHSITLFLHGRFSPLDDLYKRKIYCSAETICYDEKDFQIACEGFERIMLAAGYHRVISNKMKQYEYRFEKILTSA